MDQETLKTLIRYDPDTGTITRLPSGRVTGTLNDNGYVLVCLQYRNYRAHRLAWLYVHGRWPDGDVDHINGNRSDNRLSNLRDVSRSVNMQNLKSAHKDSSTGLLGVVLSHHKSKPYRAMLTIGGKRRYSGYFKTSDEAHRAYIEMKSNLSGKETTWLGK